MADNPRPIKRIRLSPSDSSSNNSISNFKRHEKLWFDDGTIVLVAGGTGFRVFRGLLAAHSPVFADMFAMPVGDGDKVVDGCPAVCLSDSSHDLAHLLTVLMFDKDISIYDTNPKHDFDKIFSVIRLSHKYQIEGLEHQGMVALKDQFVDNLHLWDDEDMPFDNLLTPCAIGAIQLARLTGTYSILPAAFLTLCNIDSAILQGWVRPDGSVERLSTADLRRFIDGRSMLSQRGTSDVFRILAQVPLKTCPHPDQCNREIRGAIRRLGRDKSIGDCQALFSISRAVKLIMKGLCTSCAFRVRDYEVERRAHVWDDLGNIFQLDHVFEED